MHGKFEEDCRQAGIAVTFISGMCRSMRRRRLVGHAMQGWAGGKSCMLSAWDGVVYGGAWR